MKQIALLFVWVVAAWSADVTGTWTGSMQLNGGERATAYLQLKQNGTVLSGAAGPSEEKKVSITSGRIDGDQLTVEAKPGSPILRFAMKLEGDKLTGDVFEDESAIGTISLQRAAP